MKPISVIMPVYNAERYLREAVDSILSQTFRDFEFLIINDGSTDQSLAILKHYQCLDPRIRLVSRPNTGYVIALNEMLDMAQGEFIARMDADDISLPRRFEKQIAYLRANPDCVIVGSRAQLMDPAGENLIELGTQTTHADIDEANLTDVSGSLIHPAIMCRHDALRKIGGYRKEFWPAEDADLFLRMGEVGRLANIPEVLFRYRMHYNSIGHVYRKQQAESSRKAVLDAFQRRGVTRPLPPLESCYSLESRSTIHFRWAWWALKYGNVAAARKHAANAVLKAPAHLDNWKVLLCSLRGH